MAAYRWSVRNIKVGALLVALALLCGLVVLASSAGASDQLEDAGMLEAPISGAAIEAGADPVELPETDPSTVSDMETESMGRGEAEAVFEGVFGDSVEASAEFFAELEVEEFRSDFVALTVPPEPGATPGLISSRLPLRAVDESGEKELVDLDLQQASGHFEPGNPLVEVEIPSELGDGITLPESGIRIELPSAPETRTASTSGDASAFFPNVDIDTDLVVSAAPTGLETYSHLRSPDAPTQQTFHLGLPAGDQLEARPDGGAEVVGPNGETTLRVRPPSAIDAAGQPNPVTLEVDGDNLVLSVRPSPDALYPILVDPLFESYTWGNGQGTSAGWSQASNPGFSASWTMAGADVWSNEGPTSSGNQGFIHYYVPRYWSDVQSRGVTPTTFIRTMDLSNLYYTIYQNSPFRNHPFLHSGLWDEVNNVFVSYYSRDASQGALNNPSWIYHYENQANNVNVKHGGFGLATLETFNGSRRDVTVGQATIEVTDNDFPSWAELDDQLPGWFNANASKPIYYRINDNGLGVYQLRLKYAAAEGGRGEKITNQGCTGSAVSPCPYSLSETSKTFLWDPTRIAQGENDVESYGIDPVGHSTFGGNIRIRIDRRAPELGLSGTLTEQATVGTKLAQYGLSLKASDGDDATAAAVTPFGSKGTAPGQLERPQGVAVDTEGNVWVSDRVRNRIIAFDKSGKFLREIGVGGTADGQIKDPRSLAVAPNGNIWVAEVGNKRLQQFTPTGTFVSKITKTEFSEPWGIAVSPDGKIWVADSGSQKVFQFKADGTYIQNRNTTQIVPGGGVPYGIDTDAYGNAWIAMQSTNKVAEVDSNLNTIFSFGSQGSGPGQLNLPNDVAVSDSGNILVTDDLNSRVQVFKPDGSFLRQFGSAGAANSQFNQPRGIDVGPGNTAVIADASNSRVSRWEHADQAPQSGAAKLQIKVDGTTVVTKEPGCPVKNCAISDSWMLNADNYAVGPHKVDVVVTDGVGLQGTKSLNVETHGDLQPPAIGLTGSMTEQTSLGTTRPSYRLIVKANDPGTAEERKSGVVSTSISVDGKVVDSSAPGCATEACSITREWTLNSDSYAVGSHAVQVVAKDGAGRQTTKTLTINIARDTTAPTISYLAELYNAPSGWVEQIEYPYFAVVEDAKGYGVTSTQLKIDGAVVRSESASCPSGGCTQLFGMNNTLNMVNYAGGAHPAELIATDGAGNARIRKWTINVVPKGQVPPTEAEDTLEALEAITEEEIVAPQSPTEPYYPGPENDSELKEDASGFHTVGAPAETVIGDEPEDGFTVNTADGPMSVEPVGTSQAASPVETTSDIATIASNTGSAVDTIIRPVYDGSMMFQSIRAPSGGDEFSWRVNLRPGQTLKSEGDRTVMVYSSFGTPHFAINVMQAHDAIGSNVPTTLSVTQPNVITLKVLHKAGNPAVGNAPFVYPVIAGSGWEGGIAVHKVVGPPPTEGYWESDTLEVGAPEPVPPAESSEPVATASSTGEQRKQYIRVRCAHYSVYEPTHQGNSECGNPFTGDRGEAVIWNMAIRGSFFYRPGVQVKQKGAVACDQAAYDVSLAWFWYVKPAYECHYGPKTTDGNGGAEASAGHYLRAQAHWELTHRAKCEAGVDCGGTPNPLIVEDRATELRLWPSGSVEKFTFEG